MPVESKVMRTSILAVGDCVDVLELPWVKAAESMFAIFTLSQVAVILSRKSLDRLQVSIACDFVSRQEKQTSFQQQTHRLHSVDLESFHFSPIPSFGRNLGHLRHLNLFSTCPEL